MSRTKDEIEEASDSWALRAEREDFRCGVCGCLIPYEERAVYFATKKCDRCPQDSEKDD